MELIVFIVFLIVLTIKIILGFLWLKKKKEREKTKEKNKKKNKKSIEDDAYYF